MSYDVVSDYIDDVRTLLQDKIVPLRYSDVELITALNASLLAARRLRPDLFFPYVDNIQQFTIADMDMPVYMEQPFQLSFVFGTCAHAMKRDQEDIVDQRMSDFMREFEATLTGVATVPRVRQQGAQGAQT